MASLALAAGCSGSPNTHPNGDATVPAATATVAISPADGATKVAPTGALRVTAAAGKLTRITVTAPGIRTSRARCRPTARPGRRAARCVPAPTTR
ncbi:hypothetical protein ACFQZC_37205 [Streptacidiphilus monticola]